MRARLSNSATCHEVKIGYRRKNIWNVFRDCPVELDLEAIVPPRSHDVGRRHQEVLDAYVS